MFICCGIIKALIIINSEILTSEVLTLMRVRLLELANGEYSFSTNMLIIISDLM